MLIQLQVDVEVEKVAGKFVSRDEIAEALLEELAEPGSLYVADSEYEVLMWEASVIK